MTMSRMQLHSKFLNNMLREWGRFVITVKLNRGFKDSNYDKLYAYLKQHEAHANENKMMLDRFTQHIVDPLTLMSNVSHQHHYSQSSLTPPSTCVPPYLADNAHLDSGLSPTHNLIKYLTTRLPYSSNHIKHFYLKQKINSELHQIQGIKPLFKMAGLWFRMFRVDRIEVKGPINRVEVQLDKMLLMQAQENEVAFDEEQLLFLASGQANAIDEDAPTSQTIFMANLSFVDPVYDEVGPLYGLHILSEYVKDNTVPGVQMVDNSLTAERATYKEQVELYERRARPKPHYNELNKVAIGYKNPLYLTRAKQVQPALYNGHEIIKDNHVSTIVHNTEDTLEIAEITRRKTNDKMKDPKCLNHKACCLELKVKLSNLRGKSHSDNHNELVNQFSNLEHYKELYDSIKIMCAKDIEQVMALTTKNVNLKAQILNTVNSISKDHVNLTVLGPGKYAIDVEPIPSRLRNNRDVHLNYLRHLKEM
nr:hypothetical protein [Tanacetum cinerariifolium]